MKQIAIIDDDMAIGTMLEEVLTQEGYGVLRAYSGTEALYLLEQYKPDLVLLDLMLPGLSGEELLPKIQGIPVIVLSAKAQVQDKVDLLLGGAADYLTKPFDVRELLGPDRRAAAPAQRRRGKTDLGRAGAGFQYPPGPGGRTAGPSHQNGIRHPADSAGASGPGGDQDGAAGPNQPGHPGLRGKLPEGSCEQPAQKTAAGGGKDYIETVWGIGFTLSEQS